MLQAKDRFKDKVVIVTGAASGIGAATAERFAAEGANVVLAARRKDKLEAVAKRIGADERVLIQPTDVSDRNAADALVAATVQRFSRLDVLVNNAGTAVMGTADKIKDEDWRAVMGTNLDGLFYCSRAALPELKKAKGCIVNVGSVSGLHGDWGMSAYNASKGAVHTLTQAMALDAGREGVRVNAVCPSFTRSEMTTDIEGNEALMAKFAERIPMGRPAEAAEVAAVIAFLASADAAFVNGVLLPVDGGLSASNGQPPLG